MPILINEQQSLEQSQFLYENRLKSPLARYLDTTPVHVTYYHINNEQTSMDDGYIDALSAIGAKSPIRYNKIKNFPLYGLDQVIIQLGQDTQGIDGEYQGDAIIIPGTIKPLYNDRFIIPTLKETFIFKVIDIQYDAAVADNFYRITFMLEFNDDEKLTELDNMVISNNTCIMENIGTDTTCIIEDGALEGYNAVQNMYNEIARTYFSVFYNDRHNCFLGEFGTNQYLYDPLQTIFINKHNLFNEKKNLVTIMLTDQFQDPKRRIKYEKSVYRFIERPDKNRIDNFKFVTYPGVNREESSFYRYADRSVYIADLPANPDICGQIDTFCDEFVASVKLNGPQNHEWRKLIQSYIRGEDLNIEDIPLNLNEELLDLSANLEVFIMTPIILYILKVAMGNVMHTNYISA